MKQLTLLVLFYQAVHLLGQSPLTFTKYKAADGLSSEFITTIYQDQLGFLWLGTPGDLIRYDGYHFKIVRFENYNKGGSSVIPRSTIWGITEDHQGNLWVGTENGLNRYHPKADTLTHFRSKPSDTNTLSDNNIEQLLTDTAGTIWITTANGVNRYLPDKAIFKRYLYEPQPDAEYPARHSRSPIQTQAGTVWLGVSDTLYRYEPKTDAFLGIRLPGNQTDANFVRLIYEDQSGLLWIGTRRNGAFCFNPTTNTFLAHFKIEPNNPNSLSHNKVSAFIQNGQELWIGTTGGGLNVLNLNTKKITRHTGTPPNPFGVNSETIRDAWEDNRGNIWLGSFYDGLYQFKNSQRIFNNFNENTGLLTKAVNDIVETADGKIWVAMGNAGVGVFDFSEKRFVKYYRNAPAYNSGLPAGNLRCLGVDPTGKLWVASETAGISYYDSDLDKFVKYLPKRKKATRYFDFLTSLLVLANGDIWIGRQTGLVKYIAATQTYQEYRMPNDFSTGINHGNNSFVTDIHQDSRQRVWIATYGGLNLYLPERDSLVFIPFSEKILRLLEGEDGNPSFSTAASGWYKLDATKGYYLTMEDMGGTPILKDKRKQVWSGNTEYLAKYVPIKKEIITLNQQNGLIANTYWTGQEAKNGYLYFGGPDGMVMFHPDSILEKTPAPKVVLTDFQLFNKKVPLQNAKGDTLTWKSPLSQSIAYTKELTLEHWQNYFSLEFAALDLTSPATNRYQYQLVGYDKSWIESSDNRRFITYTNLGPGRYTFQVKGATRNGPWNELTSLQIDILPPWYSTWWAYLLWIAIAFGLIYTLYHFQLNRKLALAEANRLQELDAVKTKLYTNITHEFRTPLTIILGLVDEIQSGYQRQTAAIKRNGKQLLQLVNQMLALSKLESGKEKVMLHQGDVVNFVGYVKESFQSYAATEGVELVLNSKVDRLLMDFDVEKLQLILSNLMANAIKFTPSGGTVSIALRQKESELYLTVSDTGPGIAAAVLPHIFDRYYQVETGMENTGLGIGLTLVKEYVAMLEGQIDVTSELDKGTTFTVQLPIGRTAEKLSAAYFNAPIVPQATLNTPLSTQPSERPRLLLVEDSREVQQYLATVLANQYELSYADNGQTGIQQAFALVPDLIISDVMMPKKNGFELCSQLKKDERTSHIPIILLTAKADFEAKIEGLQFGADVYLTKPFAKKELLVQIQRLLKQRNALQAHYNQLALLPTTRYKVSDLEASFLYRTQTILEENLANGDFGIPQFCRALGISRMHLHRKLKALTNQSTSQYVQSIRIARAKDLLKSTELTVAEVAYRTGYKSPSQFSQVFAKVVGKSPSVWRKA
ncbi:MAG: two-component regulator propeller domain-containing protein [Bacteroidota bacterium]